MLTTEVKQRINTCRDILVGKLPDPKSQVIQITNALIYKFMDDQDRLSEKLGGKPSFFVKELKPYAWHKLFDSKLTNQERADLYVEGIEKLSVAKHLPELFQDIFKEAYVPFKAAGTLTLFIEEINKFDYTHSEELGNAYEYLLSIMGSQGDAGQFRTPRHIIEFMVDVIDPQKNETVFDPACGTAGFLISAFKHIAEANSDQLTATDKKKLAENIIGVDISPDMAKMARVNLYLHGFTSPEIKEGDTLTDEPLWGTKYDVILANPPFMSPKGGIIPHDKFAIKAKRAEVLFTDYIAEHLKLKGRAAIIVPEGVIFQSGTTYKALRKMLVEDGYLHSVISLPAGVFQPYSGVKTSILILDRERAKESSEVLFMKIENDGYSMSSQRSEKEGSQLDEALTIAKAWQKAEKREASFASWVTKEEIAESGDYNLTGERYRVFEVQTSSWPIVELGDVCDVFNGYAFKSKLFNDTKNGLPVVRIRDVNSGFSGTYYSGEYDKQYLVNNGDLLVGMDGDFVANLWSHGQALLNQRVCRLENFNKVEKLYIYYLLQKELDTIHENTYAVTVKHISSSQIKKIKIPLPPIEVQREIVAELDRYQKIIDGARQVVENYKPSFKVYPEWKKMKLGDVGTVRMCKRIFKEQTKVKGDIPFYKIGTFGKEPDAFIDSSLFEEYKNKFSYPKMGDILLSTSGTIGRVVVFNGDPAYFQDSNIVWLDNDESVVLNEYLHLVFQTIVWIPEQGGIIARLYNKIIENTEIFVPPINQQKGIVGFARKEFDLVSNNRELLEIFEQKIKDKITEVWGE